MKRVVAIALSALMATSGLGFVGIVPSLVSSQVAAADVYSTPQTYEAQADSYITSLTAALAVLNGNITVTRAIATANSVASSAASTQLLSGAFTGVTVPITAAAQTAPPDHPTPSTAGLANFGVPGALTINALAGTANARGYASACPSPATTPQADTDLAKFTQAPGHPPIFAAGSRLLSKAVGKMAGMTVLAGTIMNAGAFTNYDTTTLTPIGAAADSFAVQATSTAEVAGVSALAGAVAFSWSGFYPYVKAVAGGVPGSASTDYALPAVQASILGVTQNLSPGQTYNFSVPFVGGVRVVVGQPTLNVASADGTHAEITVPLLNITVSALGLASVTYDILPMHAEANMSAGTVPGLQCDPVITSMTPNQGPTAGGTTVTLTGQNFAQGATTVTIGGITIPANQVSVAADGKSLTFVTPAHAEGPVPVSITTPEGDATAPGNFTYIPPRPTITGPAANATVITGTPPITGTGYPGSTQTVNDENGNTVCVATVTAGGTWTCTPTTPLAPGVHTITTTQVTAGGNIQTSLPVTFTVTAPRIVLSKVLTQSRIDLSDQFVVAIHTGSAAGPVVNSTTNSTTTGSGATVLAGTGTTGSYGATTGTTYFLTEQLAPGSASALTQYGATITCVDAAGNQTGLPTAAPFSGSLTLTPVAGADISCVLSNAHAAPTLSVQKALNSPRVQDTDQFTVAIRTGSAAGPVVSSTTASTTTGTGATVTNGTTGTYAAAAGTTYYVTEQAAGTATSSLYNAVITCTDARGVQPGLPTGAPFSGSLAITPVDGAAVSCTVTNAAEPAALRLAKANPASLVPGQSSDYSLIVTNDGGLAATTAQIIDALPPNIQYDSATGTGWTCTATGVPSTGQTVTCNFTGSIAGGGGTSALLLSVTPTAAATGTVVTNKAAVGTTGGPAGDPTACTATGTPAGCAVTPPIGVPTTVSLALLKTNPASLTVGIPADYTFVVTNSGDTAASTATVSDVLPPNISFNSATGTACTAVAQVVTCTVTGPIAGGGGAANFTINVTPTAAAANTVVGNRAAVDPTGGSEPVDPAACVSTGVPAGCAVPPTQTVDGGIDLDLTKINPVTLTVGVPADYTLTVTNNGINPAATAAVTDLLPANISFNSATGATCAAAGQLLTCTVTGPIAAAGGVATFTVNVTATAAAAGTSVQNKAAVDTVGGTVPGAPADCTATGAPLGCAVPPAQTVGNGVDLALTKTNPSTLTVGLPADYTLTVTNNGSGPAATATVSDVLPATISFNAATGAACVADGQVLTCTVPGPIAPGGAANFTINVTPSAAAAGTSVQNKAAVDPTGGAGPVDPASCTGDATPTLGCAVPPAQTVDTGIDLTLTKTNPTTLIVDVPADYSLTVTNNGINPAVSATVSDVLPPNISYNSAVGAACAAAGSLLTCVVPGPIPANGTATFTVNVTPTAAAAGTSVQNKAAVDPDGGSAPTDPAVCTADSVPAGCAVPPAQSVGNGIELSLSKTNPTALTVGVAADYLLTVTNSGTGDAATATVSELLPANLSFNSANGAACTAVGQMLTCTVSGPIGGGGGGVSFTVNVTPTVAAAGTSVRNRAAVEPSGGTGPVDPADCTTTGTPGGCAVPPAQTVGDGVDLALDKTNPPALTVGVPADYTLTVTNNGTGPATSATVSDVLPDNIVFNSATGATCSAVGQVLTCTVPGPIAPSGTADFTVNVTPSAAAAGSTVQNTAAVDPSGGGTPGDPSNCVATGTPAGCAVPPTQTVDNGVDLALTKTNPAALTVGVPADYLLTLTNNGTGPAASATVIDVLPPNISFNSSTGASCSAVGQVLTCTVPGPIAPSGSSDFSVNVTPTAAAAGTSVRNVAAVDPDAGSEPVAPSSCTATGTPAGCALPPAQTVGTGIDLALAKTNPATLTVGVPAVYNLTVTNNGTGPAATATVSDVLPANISFNSAVGASCSAVGQLLTCTVPGPIPSGASFDFSVNVTPTEAAGGTTVQNKAAVDPSGGSTPVDPSACTADDDPSGSAVPPTQTVGNGVNLTLVKMNPAALTVGVPATYTMTVTNTGTGSTPSATVADLLPPNLTYVSAAGATCSAVGQLVTCAVPGPITAGGGTATFTLTATPTAAAADTNAQNTAAVDPTGGLNPVDPATCTADGTPAGCATPPGLPVGNGVDLSLVKTNPATLTVGVPATYTFVVTNDGTGPATSATVTDTLPANISYNSAAGATCSAAGQVVTCAVPGPLAPSGGTATFTISVTPTAAAAGTAVVNLAAVDPTSGTSPVDPPSCQANGTPLGCAVPPAQTVGNGELLSLQKTNPVALTVGVPADYSFTVTNDGTGPAAVATVSDLLPDNVSYNSAAGATCVAAGQLITCTVPGPIAAAGGTAAFTISVTPTAAAGGTTAQNHAAVDPTGGSEPADPADCTADDVPQGCAVPPGQTVGNGIDLTAIKINPVVLVVGVAADYTLIVTNNGTGPAASATVSDLLPAGMVFNSATGATCVPAGQLITCTVTGPIAAGGGAESFTINVTPSVAAAGSSVQNHAAVDPTGGSTPGDPAACTDLDVPHGCALPPAQTVGAGIDLALVKTNPAALPVGVSADYALTVTNNGTGPALAATVSDVVPNQLLITAAGGAGWTCVITGQVVDCQFAGTIAADGGTSTITVTVKPLADSAGQVVTNKAAVDPTGGTETLDPATCSTDDVPAGCAVPPAQTIGSGVDLRLTKSNPAALTVGVVATYELTVTNIGTGSAASATVRDTLPAGLDFVASTGADCIAAGSALNCAVTGPIAANGGQVTFSISVKPSAQAPGTTAVNHAAVDTTGADAPLDPLSCNADDVPAGCAVTPGLPVGPGIELSLVKTNPEAMTVGVPAPYRFTVTNQGSGPSASAIVVDILPAGLTFESSSGADCSAVGQRVTCTVPGPIDALGGSRIFTLTVVPQTASSGKALVNRAAVAPNGTSSPGDPADCTSTGTPAGCAVTEPITPTTAQLRLTKTATPAAGATSRVAVGDVISYRFEVENTSEVTVSGLNVDDPKAGLVSCATDVLAPHTSTTCTVTDYRVTQADVDHGSVDNVAVATATLPGCAAALRSTAFRSVGCPPATVSSPAATTSIATDSVSELRVHKAAALNDLNGDGNANVGETVRFTVTATNSGSVTLTDLTVRDPMLAVGCPVATLPPGASTDCSGIYTVTADNARKGSIRNQAVVIAVAPGDLSVSESTNITITASAPLAPPLAYTGLPALRYLTTGLLLLLAGMVVQLLCRRRPTKHGGTGSTSHARPLHYGRKPTSRSVAGC